MVFKPTCFIFLETKVQGACHIPRAAVRGGYPCEAERTGVATSVLNINHGGGYYLPKVPTTIVHFL